MLVIRFQRKGRRHQPSFRIVVAERRSKGNGPPVEDLGFYHPSAKEASMNAERIAYWLSRGAQPTATVHNLLVAKKLIRGPKIPISMRKKAKEAPPPAHAETAVSPEAPQPS